MSKMNGKLRKKLVRTVISVVVIMAVFAVLATVPIFHFAEYELKDNHLSVERANKYNTSMNVALSVIDNNGNVKEESVKIYFDENIETYEFDQEYFQNLLKTEDSVYIIDVDSNLISLLASFTIWVAIIMALLYIVALSSTFYILYRIISLTF